MSAAGETATLGGKVLFTPDDIERRIKFVGLDFDDIERVAAVRDHVAEQVDHHVAAFFDYLAGFGEAAALFSVPARLEEAKRLKRAHLLAMVQGRYDRDYVDERRRLAGLYGAAGIDVRVFLGAYHSLMSSIGFDIMARFAKDPKTGFRTFVSLKKIGFFDMGVIIDSLLAEREHRISAQQQVIRELSTPVLQLREGLLLVPVIGVLDTHRARQLIDDLLHAIRAARAKAVVMDLTGVAAVDSGVANHLVRSAEAAQLMGAAVIVCGISPSVAEALATLGGDISAFDTVGDLQGGLERAERRLGYRVLRGSPAD